MEMLANAIALASASPINHEHQPSTHGVDVVVDGPRVAPSLHEFHHAAFPSPALCSLCDGQIWGMNNVRGLRCKHCSLAVHDACKEKHSGLLIETCPARLPESETAQQRQHNVSPVRHLSLPPVRRQQYPAVPAPLPFEVMKPESDASPNPDDVFHRKIHQFRCHEYVATYLSGPQAHRCRICKDTLADGGFQCYQCRRKSSVHVHCLNIAQ